MLSLLVAFLVAQAAPPSPATPAPAPTTPAQGAPAAEVPAHSPRDDYRGCIDRCVALSDHCRLACDNAHGTDPLKRVSCDEGCSDRSHECEGACSPASGAQRQNE